MFAFSVSQNNSTWYCSEISYRYYHGFAHAFHDLDLQCIVRVMSLQQELKTGGLSIWQVSRREWKLD